MQSKQKECLQSRRPISLISLFYKLLKQILHSVDEYSFPSILHLFETFTNLFLKIYLGGATQLCATLRVSSYSELLSLESRIYIY